MVLMALFPFADSIHRYHIWLGYIGSPRLPYSRRTQSTCSITFGKLMAYYNDHLPTCQVSDLAGFALATSTEIPARLLCLLPVYCLEQTPARGQDWVCSYSRLRFQ